MPTVWDRFSQFVKKSDNLDYYEDNRVPALGEAAQYMNIALEKSQTIPRLPNPGEVSGETEKPEGPTIIDSSGVSTLKEETPERDRARMTLPWLEVKETGGAGENPDLEIPHWLADEETLRDEGVLFGLSESEPTKKTDSIYNYFQHLAAQPERDIEQQNERVQELNLFIGQKESRVRDLKAKLEALKNVRPEGEYQLPRTLAGLVLSIAMCIGNFYLIEETLRSAFDRSSWVALGIFLAGMFSLFGRISLFHDTESPVSWRRLLEEVGMPLAAALFVFAQALQTQGLGQAMALLLFVFFLFLLAGKLLLSNITLLGNDIRLGNKAQRDRREAIDHVQAWEAEIVQLDQEINDLRVQKWQVLREQSASESERARLYARRDMLIKLFESEFYLARSMRGRLSEKQLREIRGE